MIKDHEMEISFLKPLISFEQKFFKEILTLSGPLGKLLSKNLGYVNLILPLFVLKNWKVSFLSSFQVLQTFASAIHFSLLTIKTKKENSVIFASTFRDVGEVTYTIF